LFIVVLLIRGRIVACAITDAAVSPDRDSNFYGDQMPEQGRIADLQARAALLLVDDDPLITEGLGYMLGKHYDVMIADSRASARERTRYLNLH
jgi:hypothetical protein